MQQTTKLFVKDDSDMIQARSNARKKKYEDAT